jgi:hypothetical protein
MQKLITMSSVAVSDTIVLSASDRLTFAISGSGTIQAEVKLTDGGAWFVAQECENGVIYSTVTGARALRFNQTVASGDTMVEVTGAEV